MKSTTMKGRNGVMNSFITNGFPLLDHVRTMQVKYRKMLRTKVILVIAEVARPCLVEIRSRLKANF